MAPGNVGAVPLEYPKGVELKVYSWPPSRDPTKYTSTSLQGATTAHVKGPLGQLFVPIYPGLKLDRLVGTNAWEPMRAVEDVDSPSSSSSSSPSSDERQQCALNLSSSLSSISLSEHKKLGGNWGLSRQLLRNAIQGVSEGHSAVLKMVGVGYRASIEEGGTPLLSKLGQAFQAASSSKQTLRFLNQSQAKGHERFVQEEAPPEPKRLSLRLGYSHPILLQIPQGIKVAVPSPTRIVLRSADKEALGQFAVKIRSWRPPEPYKVSSGRDRRKRHGEVWGQPIYAAADTCHLFSPYATSRAKVYLSTTRRFVSRRQRRSNGMRVRHFVA